MDFEFYLVGGYVRDKLLNRKSQDMDYSVIYNGTNTENAFDLLCTYLEENDHIIYKKNPECVSIRAKKISTNETSDFVLARKEINYDTSSRKPIILLGNLEEDLRRRDFTINAMAMDENHNIIDLFGSVNDLNCKILRTPMDPSITLLEDPLRILRGLRFSIILDFKLEDSFMEALADPTIWEKFSRVVSKERIREELNKMFEYNTIQTLKILEKVKFIYPNLYSVIFRNVKLKPVV